MSDPELKVEIKTSLPRILLIGKQLEELDEFVSLLGTSDYLYEQALDLDKAFKILDETEIHIILHFENEIHENGVCRFIEELSIGYGNIIVIVVTSESEIRDLNYTFNSCKPYDYIIKPYDRTKIIQKIGQAYNEFLLKNKIVQVEKAEKELYRKALKIFDWKKELQAARYDSLASIRVRQINIGLFHGAGFGGLMSSLSMLNDKKKINPDSGKYEISSDLLELINENYWVARNLVNGLNRTQALLADNTPVLDTIQTKNLRYIFEEYKNHVLPMLKLKRQTLIMSSIPTFGKNKYILFNQEQMKSAINELLINAMKYSEVADSIFILFFSHDNEFEIIIINKARKNEDNTFGVDPIHEYLIYEPFYRINNVAHEGYIFEEFPSGMGLSVVRWIVEKHNASITIRNINYFDDESGKDVCASIRFKYLIDYQSSYNFNK